MFYLFILLLLFPTFILTFIPFHPPPLINKCSEFNSPHFPTSLIRNVSVPARRQFFKIISSINDTKSTIEINLNNWAIDNKIKKQYENFSLIVQQNINNNYENYNKWLNGEALILLKKIWEIRKDMSITRFDECKQIHQLLESIDPKLRCIIPIPHSFIPGPPPPNCFAPFNNLNEEGITSLPNLKLEEEKSLENNNEENSTTIGKEEKVEDDEEEEENNDEEK
ncbi:DUF148 domain-containing protein [Meloidogyne graminicola]|uniref:DUF148 domain-containing protein n=1 Tax=Meloidogyne graminicola TaxID=189291 RepID=A0A8S9ZM01_9BILA|nr:DUF148 domain-containing protein [Meloidogyne graminicola]